MMARISDVQLKDGSKTIRDIPVPDRSKRSEYFPPADGKSRKRRGGHRQSSGGNLWKVVLFVVVIGFIVFGYASTTYFAKLKVYIKPITHTESYTALPVAIAPSSELGIVNSQTEYVIPYSLVSINSEESVVLTATGSEEVKTKASGTITIFNEYSASPVNLIAQTRFESSDGKIFRISKPITIPGYTKNTSGILPGKIDAVVTADSAGESYNINMDDFTIPGFKGNPRYEKVYARSKTAIRGGYIGSRPVITEASKQNAISDIREKLKTSLEQEIKTASPDASVFFTSLARLTFSDAKYEYATGTAKVTLSMSASVPVFSTSDFDLGATLSLVKDKNLSQTRKVSDISKLSIVPQNKPILSFQGKEYVTATGNIIYTSLIPQGEIKTALAGIKRSSVVSTIASFESVESAKVKFVPFWLNRAPKSQDKILIMDSTPNVD